MRMFTDSVIPRFNRGIQLKQQRPWAPRSSRGATNPVDLQSSEGIR